ncbi:unnamed protein product [Cylindrotheca closterium]|uniref:L domain-like protein n=1 Tax=Cylindrotheca closterium TaxID=2856 RepID=A0AAD2FY47_9STRA|nr:unnamed protein product [Cylindrotheca closterium]
MHPMATPPSVSAQGSCHDDNDLEVASAPSVPTDNEAVNGTQNNQSGTVSHDSSSRNQQEDHDNESLVTMGTSTSTGTPRRKEGSSFLAMMQNMLAFDSGSVVSGSEALSPMPKSLGNNDTGHSYNTLDTAASRSHEDFSDEQNCQNWDTENTAPDAGQDSINCAASVQPSLCSTPPRTRIDPEQGSSLEPPGTNGSRSPKPPSSPPGIVKSSSNNANSPFGLFRRPPPGPESSDDELKESLVMENQTQGWFGGLLHTPERKVVDHHKEPLPERAPSKTEYERFSSVASNESVDDRDGFKVVSDKNTVKVRLVYFVVLFFFLLVIVCALAFFLWYLSDLENEQNNRARDFVATMRPSALATMEPSMEPSTASPSMSLSPTVTFSPTKSPTPGPTSPPTKRPTRPPTGMPSKIPTFNPTMETADLNFMRIMADISPETAIKMESPGTTQNRAFQWLIRDPMYHNYTDDRKIQRWVLSLVKLELRQTVPNTDAPTGYPSIAPTVAPTTLSPSQNPTPTPWPTGSPVNGRDFFWNFTSTAQEAEAPIDDNSEGRRLNWDALESWMQYTDECLWFSSYFFNRVACNSRHQFKRLVLINLDLEGTIPSELSLMSRLETIALPINKITGTIPKEFGSMRWLSTFNVSYNNMEGTIPSELAAAPALTTLDVGSNNTFTGPVPNEICQKGLRVFRGNCASLQCPCCNQCAREFN